MQFKVQTLQNQIKTKHSEDNAEQCKLIVTAKDSEIQKLKQEIEEKMKESTEKVQKTAENENIIQSLQNQISQKDELNEQLERKILELKNS